MVYFFMSIILIGIILLIYMYVEAKRNRVLFQTFLFENYPDGADPLRIFFISDIHRRVIHNKIIDEVKSKADIVIIGGDLLERGVSIQKAKENLSLLKEIGPVYFVWGNNDYEVNHEELVSLFHELEIIILKNDSVQLLNDGGNHIHLLGVDDLNQKTARLDKALEGCSKESFKILVSHDPKIMRRVKSDENISLILCGHTHGGQIHIFGYSPYEKGKIYEFGKARLLISNGYGTTGVPLRLGAKPETHVITIQHG
ncbi:metallophosphoesterase [Falsibacillus albus]|uniref:Metallophosphoesterase n=1 Tax=Falsibacillus albus TaxID=2478915 RepID=A0A3L7JX14_9BACI|nr:metallophosphoesterase [Falsibacillus albus]RLQ95070.1 metallophosphoesterase [Falsibacillus albus]